jgi:hypothetical protein
MVPPTGGHQSFSVWCWNSAPARMSRVGRVPFGLQRAAQVRASVFMGMPVP